MNREIENLCINNIRILCAETVQKANSGHPGLAMGSAPMAFTLWEKFLRHNPGNPSWIDRDRFVLSAGHASVLLYSMLHLFGYDVTIDDLKNFRQWGSITPGHPEYGVTPGVETTTGPLGQGLSNAVGMAIAESHLAAAFNRPGYELINHYTYVLCGDGCLMEGVTSEAASLAGTLKLGKLIVLYDSNSMTIEGSTELAFTENVMKRFEAYGWHVTEVKDGNDTESIAKAISGARKETSRPSLIAVTTQIGFGCPAKQGKASAHGDPLGVDNINATKKNLCFNYDEPFTVPQEVGDYFKELADRSAVSEKEWNSLFDSYKKTFPELAKQFESWSGQIRSDFFEDEEIWRFEGKPDATRNISHSILKKVADRLPNLIGGSADVAPSTKAFIKDTEYYSDLNRTGRNIHFGVREHAMAAVANGISLHGGLRCFASAFFAFVDYMKPAMRMSAIMKQPVIYILTHDSIGVGEDGPTHQPVEQLVSLRSIPGFIVFRPADAKETVAGWHIAVNSVENPVALVLTRQNVPCYEQTGKDAVKGAYVILDSKKDLPDIILIATGSELRLAYEAHGLLAEKGVDARVVSMPSWELFEVQSAEYRDSVLPPSVRSRLVIEAASPVGWEKYTGLDGGNVCVDTFGASSPYARIFEEYGFTVSGVVAKALDVVRRNA